MTIQGQNHQNKQLCEIDCWFIAIQGSWGAERAFFFFLLGTSPLSSQKFVLYYNEVQLICLKMFWLEQFHSKKFDLPLKK
jgi:hypothetical protein